MIKRHFKNYDGKSLKMMKVDRIASIFDPNQILMNY